MKYSYARRKPVIFGSEDKPEAFRYYLVASGIGLLAGLIGAVFHLVVDWTVDGHAQVVALFGGIWPAIFVSASLSASMALIAACLVRYVAPETSGSGIQEVEAVLEGHHEMRWFRTLWVKFTGGVLAIGSGLVLGREGPTIHIGAAVARGVSDQFELPDRERRGLLAAGAAAGLAAAFNAPISAVLFVTEEMRHHFPFSKHTYFGLAIAAIFATIVSQSLTGSAPVLKIETMDVSLLTLPVIAIGGVVLGIIGVLFNKSLVEALNLVDLIPARWWWTPAVVIGAISGLLLVVVPTAAGGGEVLVHDLSIGSMAISALIILSILRFSGAVVSYAAGLPGGIFAPMLAIAASVGMTLGASVELLFSVEDLALTCAMIAMAALFAACVQAPLVATILVLELTGSFNLLLPLLIASISATLTAQLFNGQPIYEMLRARAE